MQINTKKQPTVSNTPLAVVGAHVNHMLNMLQHYRKFEWYIHSKAYMSIKIFCNSVM